jgi:hypothetical protein
MRGLQGAKASTQKISIEQAVYELVGQRQVVQEQLEISLVEPQLLISTEIMNAAVIGGNAEVDLLWCRRFGKTEMLVDTALNLGVYFAHHLCQNFLIGIVNPARNEQSIMVTRLRLQERINKLEPWLQLTCGMTKILGDGRKTPDLILRDSSGSECQIRAISADPTAHEKGAGFHLMLFEQVEEMDEVTMKTVLFPMAAGEELQCVQVLAGTPGLEVLNDYFRDRTRGLKYPFLIDHKAAGQFRPSYRAWVETEKRRLGEDSDEFRTQYGCEWIQLRNKLIEREQLILLEKQHTPNPTNARYAGTDCAKQVDRTVCTVLERSGAELIAIDWLELEGTNYEDQADLIAAFLGPYKPDVNLVDATATQDMIVDMLANRCRGICRTEGFKFTAESADQLWKIYEREIHQGRLRYIQARPKEPEALTRSRNRFIEEHQDVERVLRANKLKLAAPDRRGAHDDYVASSALAVYAAIYDASSRPEAVYAG